MQFFDVCRNCKNLIWLGIVRVYVLSISLLTDLISNSVRYKKWKITVLFHQRKNECFVLNLTVLPTQQRH